MPLLEVVLKVPEAIASGLASGVLERVGGVVRHADSKQIVMWLREGGQIAGNSDLAGGFLRPLLNASSGGLLSATSSVANAAITARSHHLIMQQLNGISRMLGVVGGIGVVNIAVSAVSLGLLLRRLNEIEGKIEAIHLEVQRDRDVNLRAGLDAAQDAAAAGDERNRRLHAMRAVDRLRDAHVLVVDDLNQQLTHGDERQLAAELSQAMQLDMIRIRCYMDIEDIANARRNLKAALKVYREAAKQSISMLLGTERAVYFHPAVCDDDLWRFVAILQWQREARIAPDSVLVEALLASRHDFWNPEAAPDSDEPDRLAFLHNLIPQHDPEPAREEPKHILALALSEGLIENFERLQGLLVEIDAIERLGINFSVWESQQQAALAKAGVDLESHDDYVGLVDEDELRRLTLAA